MHSFSRPDCPRELLEPILQKKVENWEQYMKMYPNEHHSLSQLLWFKAQEFFCAYCDRVIDISDRGDYGDGHIEHLERISDNPSRMGDWSNMFFSCNDNTSCGHYKDSQAGRFKITDIIDPSKENPLDYLQYDANGGVHPIRGDASQMHKAEETIRVFNLDQAPSLRALRKMIADSVAAFISSFDDGPTNEDIDAFLISVQSEDCPSVYRSLLGKRQ